MDKLSFNALGRFWAWPGVEKRALGYALIALPVAELWLRTFGYGSAQRLFASQVRTVRPGRAIDPLRAYQIVLQAARWTIGEHDKCLRRSLVLARLLRRNGMAAVVRIGFRKDGGDALTGHAWCEAEGVPSAEGDGYVRFV